MQFLCHCGLGGVVIVVKSLWGRVLLCRMLMRFIQKEIKDKLILVWNLRLGKRPQSSNSGWTTAESYTVQVQSIRAYTGVLQMEFT